MSVPSKIHNIQMVQIQPEEGLAATSELNLAPSLVTGYGEARGMGYRAAMPLKSCFERGLIVASWQNNPKRWCL
jgi:hypothetical protein